MKKIINLIKEFYIPIIGLIILGFLLFGCQKEVNNPNSNNSDEKCCYTVLTIIGPEMYSPGTGDNGISKMNYKVQDNCTLEIYQIKIPKLLDVGQVVCD